MKFFLVRHGETEWNKLGRFQGHYDISLNERGVSQAKETAETAAAWGHCAIYSSPLIRTMQVAEELARVTPMLVTKEPGLMELSLGDLEGVTGHEMREEWPLVFAQWRSNPEKISMPNGESLVQLRERTWQTILDIEQKHTSEEVITIISHNFAIRCIVGELLGQPLEFFHRMSLNLSSVCTFESDDRGRRLTGYNSIAHLSTENR